VKKEEKEEKRRGGWGGGGGGGGRGGGGGSWDAFSRPGGLYLVIVGNWPAGYSDYIGISETTLVRNLLALWIIRCYSL